MIAKLLVGMARSLFLLGCGLVALGGVFFYLSYRCIRAVTIGAKPMPVRDASFAVLVSLAGLGRAIQQAAPPSPEPPFQPFEPDDDELDDELDDLEEPTRLEVIV